MQWARDLKVLSVLRRDPGEVVRCSSRVEDAGMTVGIGVVGIAVVL